MAAAPMATSSRSPGVSIFENVGINKDMGNIEFLVCTERDIGPIG